MCNIYGPRTDFGVGILSHMYKRTAAPVRSRLLKPPRIYLEGDNIILFFRFKTPTKQVSVGVRRTHRQRPKQTQNLSFRVPYYIYVWKCTFSITAVHLLYKFCLLYFLYYIFRAVSCISYKHLISLISNT